MAITVKPIRKKCLRRLLGLSKCDRLPDVAKIAHVSDLRSGAAFFEIAFRSEAGERKSLRVPKELVCHHPNQTRDLLTRYDAALPRDREELRNLLLSLGGQDAPNWWSIAPAFGWYGNGARFVLADCVLGKNGDGKSRPSPKLLPPEAGARTARSGRIGDLESWKREVAGVARWSSSVALALSAAFAAPLLRLIDWPNFMIVLHGPGKVGKSTAALAGASVIGIGLEQDLPNWNVTSAALQEIAPRFNDQLMVLNGLESTKSKAGDLREFLQTVTYVLGDGVGTLRHSSWSPGSSGDLPAAWRSIAFVTSEVSFDEIARRAGDSRLDGERARAINVSATGAHDGTIIDFFPKSAASAEERREWSRRKVESLRAACAENYGFALPTYVAHLMKMDKAELRAEVLVDRDIFVAAVATMVEAEAQNHAAKNMGLVHAGGVQAIRAGLLPLTEAKLLRRLVRCFKRSLAISSPTSPPLPVLRQLYKGLSAAIDDANAPDIAAAFAISKGDGVREFTVHVTKLFDKWFNGDRDACSTALRWLSAEGLLEVRDKAAAERADYTIKSVRHIRRLRSTNCAVVVFGDPRPKLSAILAESCV